MRQKIEKIIIETLEELHEELETEKPIDITSQTRLYGGDGALDSLALVSLITDVEERVSDEFDKDIVLADEKAMSQRTSPFRNIESLTNYIQKLLEE
jgi:acyl carrier protein